MKRSTVLLFLFGSAGLGFCCLACCLGVMSFGLQTMTEEIRNALEADPRFVEHVGQVTSFRMDWAGSIAGGDDVYTYDVEGSKWSGRLTVKHTTDVTGAERVEWARFTLPSGALIEIGTNAPRAETEEAAPTAERDEKPTPPPTDAE